MKKEQNNPLSCNIHKNTIRLMIKIKHKDLYESEADAGKRAAILKKEEGISLTVYKCPYEDGWHLTKG